ncbi:hypothetical protein JQ625_18955 [Bradyrhizobium diazoefficiens]|nr:hypothetical protein [Bradyrhizobium diazoefficiens]MBR0776920.1 hypothetical protein [Bradyrhizobium diazoefficiens]
MQKPVQRSTLLDQADHAIATARRLQGELAEVCAAAQAQRRRREHWKTLQSGLLPAVAISLGVRARAGDQAETQATPPVSAISVSRLQREIVPAVGAAGPGLAKQACTAEAHSGHQEQIEVVAHVLEILREGGYSCELERSTIH